MKNLVQAFAEGLELAEDVVLGEVPAGVVHLARLLEVLLVLLEQLLGLADMLDELVARYVPQLAVRVLDVLLARVDHLVGDLEEEGGHALRRVVVLRDAVDHADGVHETGYRLGDGDRRGFGH